MEKLYPPTIPGTIPAFYGTSIEVPFSMNRAVGLSQFNSFALKIKKVSGTLVGTVFADAVADPESWVKQGYVKFTFDNEIVKNLVQGEFYKVQLAYVKYSNATTYTVGIYSTIGVVKYTSAPEISINHMSENEVNNHLYSYTGVYSQYSSDFSKDTTEKLYSSRFVIYDTEGNTIKDSGEIIHNTTYDTNSYEATESYMIPEELEINKIYYIYFIATTINGLVKSSPRYRITQRRQIPMSLQGSITAKLNYDAGLINIYLKGMSDSQVDSGMFLLTRRAENDPNGWEELYYFSLQSEKPDRLLFTDYTVAQGVKYTYGLQQYNQNKVYSDRMLSNSIVADFEDLFLYDGTRQLKVKFNPKVSTFKPNVVETKTNTLGSKHPFIVRNGDVDYKEFAISGLISYQMDDVELFYPKSELGLEFATHNLITENIKAERDFKLEVLEWLNNGEDKLFRSPTEGNYIVRLMNVTMSPTDTLGRMLHTFNCSAYEIDNYNYESLREHGLISVSNDIRYQMRWVTIQLASRNASNEIEYFTGQVNIGTNYGERTLRPVYHLQVTEMQPGTYFLLGNSEADATRIYVGTTGAYEIHTEKPYNYIGIPEVDDMGNPVEWEGQITYGYKSQVTSLFDLITNVTINDVPCYRVIGDTGLSVLDTLQDIKTTILAVRYVRFTTRGYYPLYVNDTFDGENLGSWDEAFFTDSNNSVYYDNTLPYPVPSNTESADIPIEVENLDSWNLYKIYRRRKDYSSWIPADNAGGLSSRPADFNPNGEGYYIDRNGEKFTPFTGYYYDPVTRSVIPEWGVFEININGETMDLSETEYFEVSGIENFDILQAGAGIVTDIGYQSQTSTYSFETTNANIIGLKSAYEAARDKFITERTQQVTTNDEVKAAYSAFIELLTEVVNRYKEENSID